MLVHLLGTDSESTAIPNEEFLAAFPINFIAPCGKFNFSWRVTTSGYQTVRAYAQTSLKLLEDSETRRVGGRSSFEAVFTTRFQPWQRYDRYLRIRIPAGRKQGSTDLPFAFNETDFHRSAWRALEDLMSRAFLDTGRATELRLMCEVDAATSWGLDEVAKRPKSILVGLSLDLAKAFRVIDKGPKADDAAAAAAFRRVWKSRSELRRFKDGSIVEAVVWKDEEMDASGDFTHAIASYLLSQHAPFSSTTNAVSLIGHKLDLVLQELGSAEPAGRPSSEASALLHSAFAGLQKHLRSLSLPLNLIEVIPVDPSIRYASARTPVAHPLCFGKADGGRDATLKGIGAKYVARHARVVKVLVRFETSGRWPDSVDGIERMKSAFYVNIAEVLEREFKNEQRCIVRENCLDILYKGYAFRVEIKHDRVIGLLNGSVQPNVLAKRASEALQKLDPGNDHTGGKRDAVRAQELQRSTVRLPVLHSQLQALHTSLDDNGGTRVMSPVVRLAKLWVAGE